MRGALLVLAVVIGACAGAGSPGRPQGTAPTPAGVPGSSPAAGIHWPLRGTAAPNADATSRRPVVVRVPNDPAARPQAGLEAADVVFEMLVEGGLTRYAVVFHSQDAASVGPIRSARLSDLHHLPMLKGILAHVGAQAQTLQRIRDAARSGQFLDVDQFEHAQAFDRVSSRAAPQNVFTSTARIRDAAKDTAKVQVPALAFQIGGPPSIAALGREPGSLSIPYTGAQTAVSYQPQGERFKRIQGGAPTLDAEAKREVQPTNVVVIQTDITEVPGYVEDEFGSLSLDIRSTGEGPAVVLTQGRRYEGKWTRTEGENYRLLSGDVPILLQPGLTWIHVVPLAFVIGD